MQNREPYFRGASKAVVKRFAPFNNATEYSVAAMQPQVAEADRPVR